MAAQRAANSPAGQPWLPQIRATSITSSLPKSAISSAGATTYYVSPQGNDSNPGITPKTAWRTINRVNQIDFEPGDKVLFEGGATFPGNLVFDEFDSGTLTEAMEISTYGAGFATIAAGNGTGVLLYNVDHFIASNLIVRGAGAAVNTGDGVFIMADHAGGSKAENIQIDSLDVSGFAYAGIFIWSGLEQAGYQGMSITNSLVHHNGDAGIASAGIFNANSSEWSHAAFYVGYNQVYANAGIPDKDTNTGNGIVLSDIDGATIEYCIVSGNGMNNSGPNGGPVGVWAWDANNVTIQYNESYGNQSQTLDGGGFDLDGGSTNSVIQYNYSHDNDGPGYLLAQFAGARPFYNNIVRYNISENDGGGITLWSAMPGELSNSAVFNNSIYTENSTDAQATVYGLGQFTDVKLLNNIFVATTGLSQVKFDRSDNGTLFLNNTYHAPSGGIGLEWGGDKYNSLNAWRVATNQEIWDGDSLGFELDPLLIDPGNGGTVGVPAALTSLNAYRLQDSSPLIDRGLDLAALFGLTPGQQDFYGTALPVGAYDIGAHDTVHQALEVELRLGSNQGDGDILGSIFYSNPSSIERSGDIWLNVVDPLGSISTKFNRTHEFTPNEELRRRLAIDATAGPDGSYKLTAHIGTYPDSVIDSSRAVYFKTQSAFSDSDATENTLTAEQFYLYQNHPNPFNPSTQIRYSLPVNAQISLKIYDVFGRLSRELVSGQAAAGEHTVTWGGTDSMGNEVASGVYFYQLTYLPLVPDLVNQPVNSLAQTSQVRKMLRVH